MWTILGSWLFVLGVLVAVGLVLLVALRRRTPRASVVLIVITLVAYLVACLGMASMLVDSAMLHGRVDCDEVVEGVTPGKLDPMTEADLRAEGAPDYSDECVRASRRQYGVAVGGFLALGAVGAVLLARGGRGSRPPA